MTSNAEDVRIRTRDRLVGQKIYELGRSGASFPELNFTGSQKDFNDSWYRLSPERRTEFFKAFNEDERNRITRISNRVAANLDTESNVDYLAARQEVAERRGKPEENEDNQREFEKYLKGEENSLGVPPPEEEDVISENSENDPNSPSNNNNNGNGTNNDPARVKKNMPKDPDWGHFDDDKFKITDGDIIDFLMKEVILESTAWGLNKIAGIGGIVVYEVGTGLLSGVGKTIKEGWNLAKDVHGNFHADSTKENGNRTNSYEEHQKSVKKLQKYIESIDDIANNKNAKEFLTLNRMIAKHYVRYVDGKLISVSNGQPVTNERFTKEYFTAVQKQADDFRLKRMKEELKLGTIDDIKLRRYFFDKIKYDNGDITEPPSNPFAGKIDDNELATAFNNSLDSYNNYMMAKPELKKIEFQSQLFGQYYSQFLIDKDYCNDDDRDKSKIYRKQRNEGTLEKDRAKKALEAQRLFLKIEQARINGVSGLPTREELLEMAKTQSEDLVKLIKDKKFADGKTYVDKIKDLSVDTKKEKPISLKKAATDTEVLNSLSEQISNLDRAIEHYENEERLLAEKRGRAHNAEKAVKEAYDTSNKEPSAKEMSLRTTLNENNALMVPTSSVNNDDIYLLIACGDIYANDDGKPSLNGKLLISNATEKNENGSYVYTLVPYSKEVFSNARQKFEKEFIKLMEKENKKTFAKDDRFTEEQLITAYRRYMDNEQPLTDDERSDPRYQLFLDAQTRFRNSHQEQSSWKKMEIRTNPINLPPQQSKKNKKYQQRD